MALFQAVPLWTSCPTPVGPTVHAVLLTLLQTTPPDVWQQLAHNLPGLRAAHYLAMEEDEESLDLLDSYGFDSDGSDW